MHNKMHNKEKNKRPVILDRGELQKLRANTDSCVEVKTSTHHITLHPFHLLDIQNSIKDILAKEIARYLYEFEGILLGYENIKLIGHQAPMFDDMCYMHQKIEADFYIFKPTIGCTLNGIINKKSQEHIGCLVHKLFIISLPKPKDSQDWLGSKAQIGQEVQFKVSFMNLMSGLPYIRGEILAILSDDSGISTSDEIAAPKKNKIKKFTDDEDNVFKIAAKPVKKKKSKKKKKDADAEEIDADTLELKTEKSKTKKEKKCWAKGEVLSEQIEEPMETNDCTTIIEELKGKYLEQLSVLQKNADADNAGVASAVKKKKDKAKKGKEDGTNGNIDGSSKKKKSKKEKKTKVNTDEKERDLLDQTLPDLNLDELFSESLSSERKTEVLKFSQNIVLPADSDLDEVLKDIPKTKRKEKSPSKKRKLDKMADDLEECFMGASRKKKKRKST